MFEEIKGVIRSCNRSTDNLMQWRSVLLMEKAGENHRPVANKGNNKITELRTILQRESQNS
jgi:hypothetical protein